MQILSLSCVFPNPKEPELGSFVRARLRAISSAEDIRVIAPIPLVDYSRLSSTGALSRGIIGQRQEGRMEIHHPRWLYCPMGAAVNPIILFLRLLPLISRLQKKQPIDWIDSHFGFPDGIVAAMLSRRFGVPFSITLRGNETMHACRSRWIRAAMQWAFRRAACMITVSDSLRRFAISMGANPETTRTIPNGVNDRIFYPRNREYCRSKLGVPEAVKLVVSAGSLIERKGHHHVMQALARSCKENFDVHLLIVGGVGREGDYSSRLQRMPAELGIQDRVRFLGQVTPEEMAEVMSAADLFCLASSREGWPNVVHEAMACGTPVVATNVGGTPEMISSPLYGTTVPTGDQAAFEKAMEAALEKEWDREAIRRWAHSRSWDQVGREVIDLFDSVSNQEVLAMDMK